MSVIMKGTEVAAAMKEALVLEVEALKNRGIIPCLLIIRVGAKPEDMSYERGAKKRMESIGIVCEVLELPENITQEALEEAFCKANSKPSIHGILLFQPLPGHLNAEPLKSLIHPAKDVDGMSSVNVARVFAGDANGFAPCTAEAVMDMLRHYKIEVEGKNVTVIGRSMVVGKPLSILLLKENATVTVCHTKTKYLGNICRNADILIAAAGKMRMVSDDMVGEQAIVADVGINVDDNGKLCGDVDFERVEKKTSYISPVPGGVGGITSSVLAKHVIRAAGYLNS